MLGTTQGFLLLRLRQNPSLPPFFSGRSRAHFLIDFFNRFLYNNYYNLKQRKEKMEYKIIKAYAFIDFEKLIQQHLDDGWAFAGNTFTHKEMLLREMVREKRGETSDIIPDVADQEFKLRYEKLLDQKFKDLLDVNNIHLVSQNGKLYTLHNDEMTEGINAVHVLQLLRASKHYPINTDEDWVVQQVENIL